MPAAAGKRWSEDCAMTLTTDDRLAIAELLALHGHIADDRTFDQLDRLLTADAVYDIEAFGLGRVVGLAAIRRLFDEAPGQQPIGHHLTNVVIREDADGTVRAHSKGLSVMADGRAGSARYDDVVVPTSDGWRIALRTVTLPPGAAGAGTT
jgi:hypothetical protein